MDFNEGDRVTMGPGLSTTVTTPHWLGAGGILLIIEGASKGVPMVGSRGGVRNESEVFIRTCCTAPSWRKQRTANT